jgi:hypothetical protein
MQVYWEKTGVLGPIYLLASKGVAEHDISTRLRLPPSTVRGCVDWLLSFLQISDREGLVLYAGNVPHAREQKVMDAGSSDMVDEGCPN